MILKSKIMKMKYELKKLIDNTQSKLKSLKNRKK